MLASRPEFRVGLNKALGIAGNPLDRVGVGQQLARVRVQHTVQSDALPRRTSERALSIAALISSRQCRVASESKEGGEIKAREVPRRADNPGAPGMRYESRECREREAPEIRISKSEARNKSKGSNAENGFPQEAGSADRCVAVGGLVTSVRAPASVRIPLC